MESTLDESGHVYGKAFYQDQMAGSAQSAREVVPLILSLITPSSVVDVGCGVGTWLSVFLEHSIIDVIGLDGAYVDKSLLLIPRSSFVECDLTKGFSLGRTFDLAISLEVAEHLPDTSAEVFVRSLTQLSDTIAFSAAVPGQGGTHHINEQWPTYWQQLFEQHDYLLLDCFREQIWDNKNIACCYRQNLFLFVKRARLALSRHLLGAAEKPRTFPLCAVHPEVFQHALSRPPTLRPLLHALPRAVALALAKRASLLFSRR